MITEPKKRDVRSSSMISPENAAPADDALDGAGNDGHGRHG